ncbi:MAG: hypothetical protein PW999_00360 [Paraburkholderia tropica]|nr:hypothetical protein [Paraburkholderia tropica]
MEDARFVGPPDRAGGHLVVAAEHAHELIDEMRIAARLPDDARDALKHVLLRILDGLIGLELPGRVAGEAARVERQRLAAHIAANQLVEQFLENAAAAHELFLVEPDDGMNAADAHRHRGVLLRAQAGIGECEQILDLPVLEVREFFRRQHFEDAPGLGQARQLLVEAVHHEDG